MTDVIKGKYRIVREIARSNDIVYEAVDTTLFDRRVAIKELNIAPSLMGQARRDRVERFHREARATSSLTHPNIVSVLDFGEENGRHFIVMEFLEGQTLRDSMQARGIYSVRDAIDTISQVLDALGHAHSHRVIHRDIKPDNIHILPGGQVKLTDFGIARLSGEPGLTIDGQVFGTPSYMSPEQIEGKALDQRSDLFSVGVLLYEMLAGRKPFVGDSVVAITYAIMNADPPGLFGIPGGIEQAIRRALAKQPVMRPRSAEEMKLQLRAGENSAPMSVSPQVSQMGMNRTGSNPAYPAAPQYGSPPNSSGQPPLPASGLPPSMQGAPPPPTGYVPSPQASIPGALPWAWSGTQQQTATGSRPGGVSAATPPGAPPGYIYGAPQYRQLNSAPLFVLGPGARTFLKSVLFTVIAGVALALFILLLKNGFENYQDAATAQQITTLMNKGEDAYKSGDYQGAVVDFQQVLSSHPDDVQRRTGSWNLAYSYMQLANAARSQGKLNDARDAYQKAVDAEPDYTQAHEGLAAVLQQLGQTDRAHEEQDAAKGGGVGEAPPANLKDAPLPAASDPSSTYPNSTTVTGDAHFVDDRLAKARQLIQDGDDLKQNGDLEGARAKWNEAVDKGSGYREAADAMERLNENSAPPDFGN